MRTIALSLIVVSGAIISAAGTLAAAISRQSSNDMEVWGILIVLLGIGLLACDLFRWGPFTDSESISPTIDPPTRPDDSPSN